MLKFRDLSVGLCTVLASLLALGMAGAALADEDPREAFEAAADLYEQGDVDGAIEEAEWGLELLRQAKRGAISTHFLDEINGYAGSALETNSAMGMTVMERAYSKDGNTIRVTLTGGMNSSMGGLGALAGLGMMGGGEKVRIQRRTGTAVSEGRNQSIMFGLKEAGMLNFESSNVSMDELKAFAEAFPIAALDDASSGD